MNVSKQELELGVGLIDKLTSEEFHPENYEDEYRIRVIAMLDEKQRKEITIPAPAPQRGGKSSISWTLKALHGENPGQKETNGCGDKEEIVCRRSSSVLTLNLTC